ncbi:MAG: hypothetical protein RJB62_1118 [Pseudomonadota bacterium]|jgi:mono/diheme cytochrome c family protein
MSARTISIVFGALALFTGSASAQTAPAGNADHGGQLFVAVGCYQCHGYVGQGGAAGPMIAPPLAFEAFELQLRTPRQVMPPYSADVLPARDAADIYAYLLTIPASPDPDSIPLLQGE